MLDLKVQEDLLENLSLRLPSSSSASCDGPITLDEARKALEGAAIGRSPGSDGLSAEFYLAFWKVLGEDLIEVFNASFSSGHLPPSLRRALITLLFKKGDRLDPKNWRPISLLNSDYKILARILAGRLSKVLQLLIHPDQSSSVQGRYIGENSVFQYSREASVPGALFSLDQEKAFDRVDHGFLFRIMSHVRFGSSFFSWVKLLYSGISSAVCINGYTSAAFFPSRGVRQGCPCRPCFMFCLLKFWLLTFGLARPFLVYDYHIFPPLHLSSLYMQMTQLSLLFLIQRFLRFSEYTHASKLALVLSSTW